MASQTDSNSLSQLVNRMKRNICGAHKWKDLDKEIQKQMAYVHEQQIKGRLRPLEGERDQIMMT